VFSDYKDFKYLLIKMVEKVNELLKRLSFLVDEMFERK